MLLEIDDYLLLLILCCFVSSALRQLGSEQWKIKDLQTVWQNSLFTLARLTRISKMESILTAWVSLIREQENVNEKVKRDIKTRVEFAIEPIPTGMPFVFCFIFPQVWLLISRGVVVLYFHKAISWGSEGGRDQHLYFGLKDVAIYRPKRQQLPVK